VPKYYWKTLPQIIEMMKQDKIAGEPAVDMIIGEIERRMSLDWRFSDKSSVLSRLRFDV